MHNHYPSFIGAPAASCSVVDGEEEQTTLTVAEDGCEMGGVEGVRGGRRRRGRERGRVGCVSQ